MTNNFLGNTKFKSCAELWREGQRPEDCKKYYRKVENFANENAGGLTRALLYSMIEFYLGVDDITQENCIKLAQPKVKNCQEKQVEEINILLERFKAATR